MLIGQYHFALIFAPVGQNHADVGGVFDHVEIRHHQPVADDHAGAERVLLLRASGAKITEELLKERIVEIGTLLGDHPRGVDVHHRGRGLFDHRRIAHLDLRHRGRHLRFGICGGGKKGKHEGKRAGHLGHGILRVVYSMWHRGKEIQAVAGKSAQSRRVSFARLDLNTLELTGRER